VPGPPADARDAVLRVVALVGAAAELGGEIEPALERALGEVVAALGAGGGAVYVKEATTGALTLRVARAGELSGPLAPTISSRALPQVAAGLLAGVDVSPDERPEAAAELAAAGLDQGLLVPARAGGQTVGALGLALPAGRRLGAGEREAVRAAAQVLALGLRNTQLFAGLQERARELDRQVRQLIALTEVARAVARSLDQSEAHRTITEEARRLVRADVAVLLLRDRDGRLVRVAGDGDGDRVPAEGLAAQVAAGAGPVRLGREAAVPIPAGDRRPGAVAGVIALARRGGEPFDLDDLERLGGLADQATVALANARLLADLRQEQEERRALAAALVLAQEQERRRVAEDLHDGPVQELVGLGLMLDALSSDLRAEAPAASAEVDRAAASARDSVRALRRAIFDLHPMALEELGFSAATRALVQRLEWRGVVVDLDVSAADVLSETDRTVAFRIVQEAIANVMRHADARRVGIAARAEGERIVLTVSDDGRGFSRANERSRIGKGHLGLAAVQERAALVGGEVTIESAEGRGTTVRLSLPAPRAGQPGEPSRSSAAASVSSSEKRNSTTT
jgi:signal transduction histidine kinase